MMPFAFIQLIWCYLVKPSINADSMDQLMGNKPEARFKFIQENAEFATDDLLDV